MLMLTQFIADAVNTRPDRRYWREVASYSRARTSNRKQMQSEHPDLSSMLNILSSSCAISFGSTNLFYNSSYMRYQNGDIYICASNRNSFTTLRSSKSGGM